MPRSETNALAAIALPAATTGSESMPMSQQQRVSRRQFLAALTVAPMAAGTPGLRAQSRPRIPVGIQLYSVRDEVAKDLMGTLTALRTMGYECVEFWAPYFEWTIDYAKQVRAHLDHLGLRCYSNHTSPQHMSSAHLPHVIELNRVLGSRHVIMAHAGPQTGLDGWQRTAELLTSASVHLQTAGLTAGYHNWDVDFVPIQGTRPIDVLTRSTPSEVGFQLDVATCLAAGVDPVAFVRANSGRIKTYHVKDWSSDPALHYRVLLGEGIGPWKALFAVAETTGGVEHYLIEQEGSRFPPMETAQRCLDNFRALRASVDEGPSEPTAASQLALAGAYDSY
jgi:sugar phosphate isomerase/epimerase